MRSTKTGLRPYAVNRKEAKELMPPSLVDRLVYAADHYPELGWLELLPSVEGGTRRETYIVLESLDRAFERIRKGEMPPNFPWITEKKVKKGKPSKKKAA